MITYDEIKYHGPAVAVLPHACYLLFEGGTYSIKRTVQGGKILFETVRYVARAKTNTAEVQ